MFKADKHVRNGTLDVSKKKNHMTKRYTADF